MVDVAAKDRVRAQFLKAIYDAVGGRLHAYVDSKEIASKLGLSNDEWTDVLTYWISKRMLNGTIGPQVALSPQGQQEVEDWFRHPTRPTQHLPAFNVVNIGTMINSQLQQGTVGSQQSGDWSQRDAEAVKAIVAAYDRQQGAADLAEPLAEELRAEMDTLRAQLNSPRPKRHLVIEVLKSIRTILENAAGSAIATAVLPLVVQFFAGG